MKNRLNFIPKKKMSVKSKFEFNYDLLVICFFAFSLGFVVLKATIIQQKQNQLRIQIKKQKTNEQKIDKKISQAQTGKANNLTASETKIAIKKVVDKQLQWPEIFKELTHIVPKDIWLNKFTAENNDGEFNMMMQGRAPSNYMSALFFSSIEQSKYFNRALLSYSERMADIFPVQYSFGFATPGFIEKNNLTNSKKKKTSALDLFSKPQAGINAIDNEAASKALKSVLSDQLRLDALSLDKKKSLSK